MVCVDNLCDVFLVFLGSGGELLHSLVRYTQHSRRVRDGFEFVFPFFVPRVDTVLVAVPKIVSSRVSVQVNAGEFAFQSRAYTSMQVIELPKTSHLNLL